GLVRKGVGPGLGSPQCRQPRRRLAVWRPRPAVVALAVEASVALEVDRRPLVALLALAAWLILAVLALRPVHGTPPQMAGSPAPKAQPRPGSSVDARPRGEL